MVKGQPVNHPVVAVDLDCFAITPHMLQHGVVRQHHGLLKSGCPRRVLQQAGISGANFRMGHIRNRLLFACPFQRKKQIPNRAAGARQNRTDDAFQFLLRQHPVQAGTPRHSLNSLPELVRMQTGIRISQDRRQSAQHADGHVNGIKISVMPDDERANVSSFHARFLQTRGIKSGAASQRAPGPAERLFPSHPMHDRLTFRFLLHEALPMGPYRLVRFYIVGGAIHQCNSTGCLFQGQAGYDQKPFPHPFLPSQVRHI